jgi:acyl-CoA dehydrogenase
VRSLIMALTLRASARAGTGRPARYYQHIERFSASFAFATDVAMLTSAAT